jgi:antitoxin (DNA-binding transcriptional repressor) of toxin-antitoxin stability system
MQEYTRIVTATEAGRHTLRLFDEVKQGSSFLITRYGKPAATMKPHRDENGAFCLMEKC